MPQTSITTEPAQLWAGMPARPFLTDDIITGVVSQTGGIGVGLYCCKATADGLIKSPISQAEVEDLGMGFVMRDQTAETPVLAPGVWLNGDLIAIMRHGYVGAVCETDCVSEGKVYVRIVAGAGGTVIGAVRKDADTASAILLPRARFKRSLLAAGVAEVEVW
jgi:hypothetical protein